jgi:quercetin dioxygenase-like cupin family protein
MAYMEGKMSSVTVRKWEGDSIPDEDALRQSLEAEGLQIYHWSNEPGEKYDTHSHTYHKIIYVIDGSVTFTMPDLEQTVHLEIGDRMDLPAGVVHSTTVGDDGVVCLEVQQES